ncbi:Methyltransferase domain-containing protein [Devosia lucknowensis]|uniref:Methyltransferase domain-containing protein n=1 Tax=Devosia lucknowensis TaxID=1096929 RepID=A0A1Y6GC63_9HYPH|nr:class I SAM-dependent methyltransferase [Devosia lucknowensis]SMQ86077.1 Methyltransferase domain-containing protein [Devosia lucknowensis]
MADQISPRIAKAVAALPLKPDLRILEIGCGTGVAARSICGVLTTGKIVAIDRSAKAIAIARAGSATALATGRLEFRQSAIEDFVLAPGEAHFDFAFAMRVGSLDGRHPELASQAIERLRAALKPDALVFVDDRAPLSIRDISRFS